MLTQSMGLIGDKTMNLLEYQAKELFRSIGIPVLPSQRIESVKDLKQLNLPYPVVLKSQVYMGGRGRLGGVRFVNNTIDAIAAAQVLFNLPILGETPQLLLAEAKFKVEQEFYLAVTLNRSLRRLVLLGSMQGGTEVQNNPTAIQQVSVEGNFSAFYARRLAINMGLSGGLMTVVSGVIEKMYHLLVEKDLDLVEINPLGVSADGTVMALDGKISVNDGSLSRHPDLAQLSPVPLLDLQYPLLTVQPALDPDGIVGILCNGSGLTMSTMDSFYQAGGKPKAFLNIGSETHHHWQPTTLCDRLLLGLDLMHQQSGLQVILLNLVSGVVSGETIVDLLLSQLQRMQSQGVLGTSTPHPLWVVRWIGPDFETAADRLKSFSSESTAIYWCDDLDEGISQVLKQVKLRLSKP